MTLLAAISLIKNGLRPYVFLTENNDVVTAPQPQMLRIKRGGIFRAVAVVSESDMYRRSGFIGERECMVCHKISRTDYSYSTEEDAIKAASESGICGNPACECLRAPK